MMEPKNLKNLLYQIECVEYRIPKQPILLNKNGHEFKCPTCGTVFDSPESHVSEYDLCNVCGQLWKDHGTTME